MQPHRHRFAVFDATDRYGDVLNETEPTVGDVKVAGADLAKPSAKAFDGADAAVAAHEALLVAQQDLVDAQVELEEAKAGPTGTPSAVATVPPAAGLFSTTTGWLNFSFNFSPIVRASTSSELPAGAGTRIVTCLSGQPCASETGAMARVAAAASARNR